jgi:ubiquinone/menaquinone biosynthesis C-methylase UbiE
LTERLHHGSWASRTIDRIAARRAERIARRLAPWLPERPVLDVGSGTGHNAAAIRKICGLEVHEADVIDFHRRGRGPRLFDGKTLPFETGAFQAAVALHVLQYPADPASLLREMARVSAGQVLVFQTVAPGSATWPAIAASEWLGTPGAFLISRALGYIPQERCSVWPKRLFTARSFRDSVRTWGFEPRLLERGAGWPLRDDLYLLESRPPA